MSSGSSVLIAASPIRHPQPHLLSAKDSLRFTGMGHMYYRTHQYTHLFIFQYHHYPHYLDTYSTLIALFFVTLLLLY